MKPPRTGPCNKVFIESLAFSTLLPLETYTADIFVKRRKEYMHSRHENCSGEQPSRGSMRAQTPALQEALINLQEHVEAMGQVNKYVTSV